MNPDKFRESRQEINRMYENINELITKNDLEGSKEAYEQINVKLDLLRPQAEGEIQKRSVKNLSVRINSLVTGINKIKPRKKQGSQKSGTGIAWDENLVKQLSPKFLTGVFNNMQSDKNSQVSFGTTGKGIRPRYHIQFSNGTQTVFNGSGHTPVKNTSAAALKKMSDPFRYEFIESVLQQKE
jgi:hypothetical protein